MEINWDSIKYIFQIPRDWFRYIHRKIHNAYGVLFIRVMDGEYGGMKIDIDKQVFKETVEDAINLDEYVKSVNDVKPDEKGNVDLSQNFLEASDITTPGMLVGTDYNGEQTVCSPNHKHNIKDVDGSIKTINGKSPDENGNVVVEQGLKTVNEIYPDENGNVDLGILVKSVNDHEPDENGKITFSVVEKVDGVEPVNGNVPLGAIRSINNTIRPVNGNVNLTGVFAPVEHTHPHTQISDWNNATKDFLEASELTSPGIVVGTDYDDPDHPVCYPNHKHNAKDIVNNDESGFVTVNTDQEITGKKTFKNIVQVLNGSNGFEITPSTNTMTFGNGSLSYIDDKVQIVSNNSSYISLSNNSAFITAGMADYGISIVNSGISLKVADIGFITIQAAANNARLANQPTETSQDSLAIATCGYVQKNAITIPEGKELKTYRMTVVTDVTWNGTQIVIQKKTFEFTKGVLTAVKNASSNTINTVAYTPS